MIITNKLAKYRSKEYCNLDQFNLEPFGHKEKKWKSRDGRIFLVAEMETSHLWHSFNMLQGIIESNELYSEMDRPDWDSAGFIHNFNDMAASEEQADLARVAIQYIGHELYKRGAQVPALPEKNFRKKINRADNLHRGFVDTAGECLTFNDDWE